jgi:predicted nucleotide-binding protein
MMALLLDAIRRRYEIDPDARYYDWDDLSAVGAERDSVKLTYHVASIAQLMLGGSMDDSGDRPNIRLGMPSDVERLLADLSSMTFEQYIVHAANHLPKNADRRVERPLLTAPLWLDEDGVQGAPVARRVATFSPSGNRDHDKIDDLLDEYEEPGEIIMPDPRKVFVVYGRDDKQKDFFFDLLRRIQLIPIEFEEAIRLTGSGSPYIGDAVSTALKHAQVVLVLFTGDDLAHLRPELVRDSDGESERKPSPQPRQNVILEAGMALALDRDRTIIVEVPPLRGISDLHGLHVIRFGKGEAPERNNLVNRLETAGCDVKRIGNDWLNLPFPSKPPGP